MANKFAVTEKRDEVGVWTAEEWEEAANTFVNVHSSWFDSLEEAEAYAAKRRNALNPQ